MSFIVTLARWTIFLLGGLYCWQAGHNADILSAASFLAAMIAVSEIEQKRSWGVYGYAIFSASQLGAAWMTLAQDHYELTVLGAVFLSTRILAIGLFIIAGAALSKLQRLRESDWPRGAAWLLASIACVLPLVFFERFTIPTGGMENSILTGDRILVSRFTNYSPRRGDIVAFFYPVDRRQRYVKRIVGMPHDHIRLAEKVVYLDGAPLAEPYAIHAANYVDDYRDNFPVEPVGETKQSVMTPAQLMLQRDVIDGELIVPAGKYFVLGDNRDYSLDSRYWGFVDAKDIIGRPFVISESMEPDQDDPTGVNGSLTRIRWKRFFTRLESAPPSVGTRMSNAAKAFASK